MSSYPFSQGPNNSRASDYPDYRPSSRHNLFYDKTPTPSTPPHLETRPVSPFNPYARTEEPRSYTDYRVTPPVYAGRRDSNPFVHPTQDSRSYQNNFTKPGDSSHSFVEQGLNAPSPPPPKRRTLYSRLFNGEQKFAYFCWTISIIQIGVFIGELVRNAVAMKTPIQIRPVFNPLLGPSSYVHPFRTTG